jgi:hypothetical protein
VRFRSAAFALVPLVIGFSEARAQQDGASASCVAQTLAPVACYTAAQALASAFPQIGIASAGGSPVLGTEGTRGVTLGFIPKTTGTLRLNVARVRLPDLRAGESGTRTDVALVAKIETATRLFDGLASGTVTGIGSLDLLLDAGVLPATGAPTRAATELGAGARLGIVRETFGMPGVAVSAMVRHTARTAYGDDCGGRSGCAATGAGEVVFPVTDVGARLTVGKRVGPVGLLGGAGWNRFSTRGEFAYRGTLTPSRATDVELDDTRWSLFADLSYALTVGSLVLEGGWMSGGDAVGGFSPGAGGYDPGQGTAFGSLGLRISL